MPLCNICGRNAGFLSSQHPECAKARDRALRSIPEMISSAILRRVDLFAVRSHANSVAACAFLSGREETALVAKGWAAAFDFYLQDGILSNDERAILEAACAALKLTASDLQPYDIQLKMNMASALTAVVNGQLPSADLLPFRGNVRLHINFQKSEQLCWVFDSVHYYEEKAIRQYVAGTSGVSMRIAKGVYYRVAATRGYSYSTLEMQAQDTGVLVATDKNLYFGGSRKSFRLPYKKIVSFEPHSDGFSIVKEAANPKPQAFVMGYGWFACNLVANLARIGS